MRYFAEVKGQQNANFRPINNITWPVTILLLEKLFQIKNKLHSDDQYTIDYHKFEQNRFFISKNVVFLYMALHSEDNFTINYIHFEIERESCNLIGSRQLDFSLNCIISSS